MEEKQKWSFTVRGPDGRMLTYGPEDKMMHVQWGKDCDDARNRLVERLAKQHGLDPATLQTGRGSLDWCTSWD